MLCSTDPFPLSEMYSAKGVDKLGLTLWHCHRGTSGQEGMHGHHNKLFKGGNYGRRLAQVILYSITTVSHSAAGMGCKKIGGKFNQCFW